ncbi:MAG: hypothetical protein ACRYGR_00730 [Janthinobacterium lividum]
MSFVDINQTSAQNTTTTDVNLRHDQVPHEENESTTKDATRDIEDNENQGRNDNRENTAMVLNDQDDSEIGNKDNQGQDFQQQQGSNGQNMNWNVNGGFNPMMSMNTGFGGFNPMMGKSYYQDPSVSVNL